MYNKKVYSVDNLYLEYQYKFKLLMYYTIIYGFF